MWNVINNKEIYTKKCIIGMSKPRYMSGYKQGQG